MLFNEFGSKNNPVVLLMHGMMQDWKSEYELLKPLEDNYRLIITGQAHPGYCPAGDAQRLEQDKPTALPLPISGKGFSFQFFSSPCNLLPR